jgi:hypothetical protein
MYLLVLDPAPVYGYSQYISEKETRSMKGRKHGDVYRIEVKGHLDSSWSEWFDGLSISNEANGTTALTGVVVDQAALHGLIARVRDLGLPLLLVECVTAEKCRPNQS